MEELDIDTDNLCTTEDAFEQFQSGAMYEEDEFITLSDIVSSPHTNHDVNEILHHDPCDEVVSMSIQNEKTNNITIPSFEQNEVFDVNSQKKNLNNKNKNKTRTPKRRGRKKKGSFENNDVQQTQSQIEFNKPTKPKRQSRKSIIASDTSDLKYVELYVIEEPKGAVPVTGKVNKPANKAKRKSRYSIPRKEVKEQIKKKGKQAKLTTKKIQKESLHEDKNSQIITSTIEDSNISTTTSTYDNKKIKHKRGRKKQNTSCQNTVLSDPEVPAKMCEIKSVIPLKKQNDELESSMPVMPLYDEINKGSEVNDKPNITNKKSLRNSVVSDSVKNDVSDEDIEDLPLSNLSKKTENEFDKNVDTTTQNENMPCTTLENKNFSDSIIHSKDNTSNGREIIVKKRGRPKKIPDNSNTKSDLENKKIENIKKVDNISDLSTQEKQNKCENPEIISEPVLFSDNESQIPNSCEIINTSTESNSQSKRNSKKKLIPDFEYNVDSVVKNDKTEDIPKLHEDYDEKLDTEDSSRRPVRRRVLKNWNYDEGSDEDPYANVELSDDEPRRRKKGGRCYSDDEYFPGDKRQLTESESDIAMDEDIGLNDRPQKKKKCRKSDLVISNKSSRKKGRKSDAESICTTEKTNTNTDSGDIDFEDCLESSIIRGNENQTTPTLSKKDSQSWGKTNEFENFIAKIVQGTDIKISKKSVDNVKASLQIPVIEAIEVKKNIEKSVQTITVNTKPACVQTDTAYEIPMKNQVPLTGEQSEKACEFLSSIVQTTAELGQLMTQKSEDFITKKINTKYVTDTFKMDYCVKKSFLLFKLAKYNLVQMEEDLSKQYEEFLRENNLIQHRQEQKIIASTSKASDSDCEIVEEPVKKNTLPKAQKPAFNPKTVFLNKELSIKIAKKPTEEPAPKKKLNIQGSDSVWINDSISVKKVKPNQSFLAQDSRNKKPPDNEITLESVNNFFKMYERQTALFICAPFIKTEWFGRERKYMCNYFVDSTIDFPEKTVVRQNENVVSEVAFGEHESNHGIGRSKPEESIELGPETLSLLCTKILQNCLHSKQLYTDSISNQNDINQCEHVRTNSQSLTNNVVEKKHFLISDINKNIICLKPNYNALIYVQPLKTLCYKKVTKLISNAHFSDGKPKLTSENLNACVAAFHEKDTNNIKMKNNTSNVKQIKPLLSLCVKAIQKTQKTHLPPNINNIKYMPKSLKSISFFKVQTVINGNINANNTSLKQNSCNEESLIQLCIDATNISSYGNSNSNNTTLEQKKNNVKTLLQLCIDATNISSYGNSIVNNTSLEQKHYNAKSLLQLCIDAKNISSYGNSIINNTSLEQKYYNANSLLQLCIDAKNISSYGNSIVNNTSLEQKYYNVKSLLQLCIDATNISSYGNSITNNTSLEQKYYNAKSLLQLCIAVPNMSLCINNANNVVDGEPLFLEQKKSQIHSVLTLKSICCKKITELSTEWYTPEYILHEIQSERSTLNFTINNVNTVSDDVFLEVASDNDQNDVDNDNYVESSYNEEEQNNYSDVDSGINYDDLGEDDNNWVSQVQMQELRSCLNTIRDMEIENEISEINENKGQDTNVQIKLESNEYLPESVDSSNIKTEPGDDHEYMGESNHYSAINMITKQEDIIEAQVRKEPICRQNSNSYDEQLFESFVSANKMIAALNEHESTSDEIFSQSSQRVRRQHEPDSEDDFDVLTDTMNLLVPQNDDSKNRLMESSEEEDDEKEYKKTDKKKPEKRKCKSKNNNKDLPNKGKMLQKNEVTVLTKKMKDKIRQEHDKSESSDSEPDCLKLRLKIDKEKTKENESNNESNTKRKEEEKVIQCNDVDSTELITENKSYPTLQNNNKNGYPDEDNTESITDERSLSPLIDSNVPVEVVECEPTLPIFDEFVNNKREFQKNKKKIDTSDTTSYVEHAWKCYPIDREDSKIYAHAHVLLHKLPESFVETYFKYQDVIEKTTEDIEIDKLTNLQSLQSTISKKVNNLSKTKPKAIEEKTKVLDTLKVIESNDQKLKKENSPLPLEEFSASEDESPSNVDKYIPSTPVQSNENKFAKKLLMNDSDTEKADVEAESTVMTIEKTYKTRSGRTIKCKVEKAELEKDDMMLTADKMMNKELALLHAPVDLKTEEEDSKNNMIKLNNKNFQKNVPKGQTTRYEIKTEDDSSSEEEKQWFTTKEKLLKRLLKKNEDTNVDDAKRAKIVSEFIEKRGERPETRQRVRTRTRCSKKTVMERRKQIKMLSRELFGVDTVYSKKYSPANTSNGRRNIRKVIDKKSLARSTVLANMEEFERKRRLTLSQAQLREDLGCEEGVNVVVINDELCLEYDFEKKRPLVSVHQFFTKVMKAHQYEGVKFMWDACFESVSRSVSGGGGGGGGGCILAHCMGLGKTLQVLALLHTVLTHPEVGMRRVLVCCPLSTVLNWVDEIHKWIGPVTNHIKVFELSKLKKTYERAYQLEDWYNGGGIFIIGYELFRSLSTLDPVLDCIRPTIVNKIRTALLDPGPDIIVCDEGHLLKNDCSVLSVAMSRVVTKRRIILTGTPMQNNLREYYCMVNFVKPNLLGSYSEYSNRFENPIMNGQHRDSREEDIKLMKARTHILHKVLEGCLQRQEASVLYPYLPKKYEYTVFISLTKCQWELYKHYLTHYINTKENKQSVLRDFHVLQKIWTHPLVLNNFLMNTSHDEREPKLKAEKLEDECEEAAEQAAPSAAAWWARTDHRYVLDQLHSSYKFLVVFQLLHECVELGDKVLIFSTSLYAMDALEFFLKRENKWTLGRDYYRLDGSVPAEVRQKWCREFNAPQNTATKLFLISTRAGSLGLNMTAANRVIILDTSWNPAHDIQSIFRVYRFGQKKDCYIYRLVAMGTMEQKIYERSVTKQAVACRVVDEQQIDRHYNMAELSELYRLDEAGSGVSAGLAAGVRDTALLRVAAAAAEGGGLHAVHEHDSLLRGSSESVLPEHERNAAWMQFQQEHATTHIRNFEINLPKQSIEDTDVRPKTDNIELKKENECETPTDNTTPKVIKKSKRKSKTKNIEPEPQPSTSQQDLNPEVEESMIKKIMNILIKHNFHKTKCPEEISALVMNVRDVVAKAPKQSLNDADTLTESIARVLLESEHTTLPEDEIESDDDTDLIEMNLQQRKRRKNRNDSDEEYLPNTRKRKSTANTKKSNESVNTDNNYAALDSDTQSTNIISNKEVLEKESVVISLNKLETLSKEPSESNHIIKYDERSCKQSNKKVKIHKNDVRKETQRSYVYEPVENESLNESSTNVSTTDILDKKRVVIKIKKSETLNKKPSETKQNEVKIDESASKQSNKNVKTTKNDVEKEKQPSNICKTVEDESSNECIEVNDNSDIHFSKEEVPLQPTENESKTKNIEPEPQPSTSQQDLNPEVEESMIKKIMNLLIKHNFHKTKCPEEISALVMNVRDVVAKALKQSLNDTDTLTESIARVLLGSEHTTLPEDEIESDDDTDLIEMNLQQRKRRSNRNDSDEEYLSNTRKRKSTDNTKKSNESVNSNNNYAALDSNTESTNIISNKEVLEKESIVICLNKLETLSKEPSESNHIIKYDERSCKQSNKKVKIHKNDLKKGKQQSYIYETEENDTLNESTEVIAGKELLEKEPVVISLKKPETLSKKPSESSHIIKYDERSCKQSNKKVKIHKNDLKKGKQQSYIYETEENETLNESTEVIAGKELLEKEPVVISLKKPETLSKKPSESSHIVKIDESVSQQCNKKVKKDVPKEKQPSNIYKTVENESSNESIEVNDNSDIHFFTDEAPVQPTENESIYLSDDDEPIITDPAPPIKKDISKIDVVEKIEKDETIPLHKSVLTNKNFIKLVAHTYLSGNPMLDEDAALLAAQYSTLKAVKEVQATGKNLTSGPIHDIAVKVLGRALMKRLLLANPNKYTAETMLLETENLQNKTMNDMLLENSKLQKPAIMDDNKKLEPETKTMYKRKIGILRKTNVDSEGLQTTTKSYQRTISLEATNTKVVPVGIFKGPVALPNQQPSLEECILPDDEVIIAAAPTPSPAGTQVARRNSKQLVINTVSSKESSGREQSIAYVDDLVPIASVPVASRSTAQSTTNNIKPAKASLPNTTDNSSRNQNITKLKKGSKSEAKTAVNIKKNTTPPNDVTICLDSDEEDIPSFVICKKNTKPVTSSDSRTLLVTPLVKNHGKNYSEIDDNKKILVPVTSVNTSSSSTLVDANKTRTASIDQRKTLVKEINAPKVNERKCKPGDIIRINESGKVEILKRITDAELSTQLQATKLKDDDRSENNSKKVNPLALTDRFSKDKLAKNVSDKVIILKQDKRKEIPSTSKQQKDPDPLSVLKNIIHIPAFKYEKTAAPKPPVEKTLQTCLPSAKEVTANTKLSSSKLLEVKPVITFKGRQQVIITKDKQTIVKKKIISTKSTSAIKTNDIPKTKSPASKDLVIDLTSFQQVQIKKASVPALSKEVIVVAGSSKDTGTHKVSSVVSDPKKSTVATIGKTLSKASPKSSSSSTAVPSTSESKRSLPWSEGAQSKKQKTESRKKLSLKDFNLDDFDDIIELE